MSDDILKRAKEAEGECGEEYSHCELPELVEELVAEYERLRSSMIEIDGHRKIIELRDELAWWQQIAIEERAKILFYIQYEENPQEQFGLQPEKVQNKYREQAARELGIDSSEHFSGSTKMVLTSKQRAALEYAISSLEQCDSEPEDPVCAKILQAMLSQSRPGWEITEERKVALKDTIEHCRLTGNPDTNVLQAMLDEVQGK